MPPYPAGTGPAGHEPVPPDPTRPAELAPAVAFDPQTRTFLFDEEGEALLVHPVDQGVALALGFQVNGVAAAPGVGLDVARLKRTSPEAMQQAVLDVVRTALAPLIDAGDIAFYGAPLMPDADGRPWFFVDYANLRLPSSSPKAPRLAIRR